jgi:hypothetical protein
MRWQTKVDSRGNTSGPLIAEGKVISGGACAGNRANCYISAHDALTGKEVWRFYTTPAPGEPGDESWAGAPVDKRLASTWGLPGAYDPVRKMLYWGIANAMPDQRAARHDGNPDAISRTAPADLYSNSTIALDPNTGKLAWYYQHLPGDDWDSDYTHERTLVRTRVNPDPKFVKWINPDIPRGQEVDLAMLDATVALLTYQAGNYFASGKVPARLGNRHPSIVPYETFTAADGEFVLAVGNDEQWRRFCAVAALPEDERFATNRQRVKIDPEAFEIKEEFKPQPGDVVIFKERASGFFGTPLVAHLTQLGCDSLIVCGESTSGCVRASCVDGYSLGYHVSIAEECVFDRSQLSHKVNLFDMHHKYCDVMKLEEVKEKIKQERPRKPS